MYQKYIDPGASKIIKLQIVNISQKALRCVFSSYTTQIQMHKLFSWLVSTAITTVKFSWSTVTVLSVTNSAIEWLQGVWPKFFPVAMEMPIFCVNFSSLNTKLSQTLDFTFVCINIESDFQLEKLLEKYRHQEKIKHNSSIHKIFCIKVSINHWILSAPNRGWSPAGRTAWEISPSRND